MLFLYFSIFWFIVELEQPGLQEQENSLSVLSTEAFSLVAAPIATSQLFGIG